MKKFQEYLNNKGTVKGAEVEVVADWKPDGLAPGRMKMPPESGYGTSTGRKQQPYTPDGKHIVKGSGKKAFGDQGSDEPYNVTKRRDAVKIPTAEAKFAYHELLPKVRDAIKSYPAITENLVRELQRSKLLGILVGEMLSHNETYEHIAEVMASRNHGPNVCRKLAKAMREGVAPPFHHAMDQEDEMNPNSGGVDPDLGLGTGEGDDMGGDDMGGDDGRPSMNFDDDGGDDDDDFGDFGDDDEFGDDSAGGGDLEGLKSEIEELKSQVQALQAQLGGGEMGPDAGMGDPNAAPPDPNAPPSPMGPDGQPLPPDPNQPPVPPQPAGPPAMENMRRAMKNMFENYRPLTRKTKKQRVRR